MTFKAKLMTFTAGFAFAASMASAAITANDVVKSYQEAMYSYIEVKDGPTQIKVEAIKENVKVEVIYDKASGDVMKTEQHRIQGADAARSGVEVKTVARDFADHQAGGTDDDASDDDSDHHGSGTDDHSGDEHDGGQDDHGDDHGSSDHSGGDDHGGSDHDSGDHDSGDHDSGDDD